MNTQEITQKKFKKKVKKVAKAKIFLQEEDQKFRDKIAREKFANYGRAFSLKIWDGQKYHVNLFDNKRPVPADLPWPRPSFIYSIDIRYT